MAGIDMMFGQEFTDVNVNLSGAKIHEQRAKDIAASSKSTIDFAGVTQGVAAISSQVVEANKITEANKAKQDYLGMVMSEGYRDADAVARAEMYEGIYGGLGDQSKAYQDAFIGYSSGQYIKEVDERSVIEDNAIYSSAPASMKAWMGEDSGEIQKGFGVEDSRPISNEELGKTPMDFAQKLKETNPRLDMAIINTALLSGAYEEMMVEIVSAGNETQLSEALKNIEDIKKPYKNPTFLQTKSKKGSEIIRALETQIGLAVKNKKAEFKEAHFSALAEVEKTGNRTPPSIVEGHIDATASNPYASAKQKTEYRKKYEERIEADDYNGNYGAGNRTGIMPDNKTLKDERQKMVTSNLYKNFTAGNASDFVRVANNEVGMTKQMGEGILTQFNKTEKSSDMDMIMNRLNEINQVPQGATVLRQMFSDDEYTRIMSIKYRSMYKPNDDMDKVRDYIDQTAQSLQNMKLDPKSNAEMLEYATELGDQAGAYLNVMSNMLKINPQLAKNEYKDIARYFEGQVGKDNSGMKENVSMSPSPSSHPNIIDKDAVDVAINAVLPEGTTSKTYLPGGVVMAKDAASGTIALINVTDTVKEAEEATIQKMVEEQAQEQADIVTNPLVGAKVAAKSFIRTLVDNVGNVPGGIADVGGTLIDRFGQHLYDSMDKSQQEWWSKLTEDDKSDIVVDAIESEGKKIVTDTPLQGVQNVTLNPLDKAAFEQAVLQGKAVGTILTKAKDEVVGVPSTIIGHLEDREGSVNKIYKDSLGNPTGGVGHLLTKEELELFPIGTKIPEEVKNRWLRQDSRKAFNYAKEQAKDLQIADSIFIKALTSVNFQLGGNWKKKFPTAYKRLKEGRYEDAIQEIVYTKKGSGEKSNWNKQTPVRVKDFVEAIRQLK